MQKKPWSRTCEICEIAEIGKTPLARDNRPRLFLFIIRSIIIAAEGARPAVVGNSFSATTGDSEPSESAIWVVGSDGQVTVRWVNADGCKSPG